MGGRIATILFIVGSAVWGAPYQKIVADIPSYLPPGVKDSTLMAWGPPVAVLPRQAAGKPIEPVVWMRITVGARGQVVSSQVVYSTHPMYHLERAATEAVKKGLFYAVWDGLSPVEYIGYFPVVFWNSVATTLQLPRDIGTLGLQMVIVPGSTTLQPAEPADWKSLQEYIGRDAPIVEPTAPITVEWPAELRDSVCEATAWLKVRIDRDGSVVRSKPFVFLRNDGLFDKAANEAVRNARFPVKESGKRSFPYDAYVAVPFFRPSDFFTNHGLPRPEDILPEEQSLRPLDDTAMAVLPIMDRAGIAGTVRLRLLVDTSGKVLMSRLDSSSGFVELDRLAYVKSSELQYKPTGMGGTQSPVWTSVRLSFTSPPVPPASHRRSNPPEFTSGPNYDTTTSSSQDTTLPKAGEFQVLDQTPEVLKEANAEYPRLAQQAGIQGKVVVWGLVDTEGRIIQTRIAQSSGTEILDNAAANALLKYKFRPGISNGRPVKCWISKAFTFKIN